MLPVNAVRKLITKRGAELGTNGSTPTTGTRLGALSMVDMTTDVGMMTGAATVVMAVLVAAVVTADVGSSPERTTGVA
jgi:hypothetical protein